MLVLLELNSQNGQYLSVNTLKEKKILYLENHSFKCTFISAHLEFHQSVETTKTMDKIVAPQKLI